MLLYFVTLVLNSSSPVVSKRLHVMVHTHIINVTNS